MKVAICLGCAGTIWATRGRHGTRRRALRPTIVLQALGGWKDSRMVRTYTHLAGVDLLDHANAIRLPSALLSAGTNSSTVAVSEDSGVEENLNVISGVDDGIRTRNNRNHNPGLYR